MKAAKNSPTMVKGSGLSGNITYAAEGPGCEICTASAAYERSFFQPNRKRGIPENGLPISGVERKSRKAARFTMNIRPTRKSRLAIAWPKCVD